MSVRFAVNGTMYQLVYLDNSFYVNLGQQLGGKSWLKFDGTGSNPAVKSMTPLLAKMKQLGNPMSGLVALTKVPVTVSAHQTVDGVDTTRYSFTHDTQLTASDLPSGAATSAAGAGMLGAMRSVSTYYLNAVGLPIEAVTVVTLANQRTTTTTEHYSHWGEPVTIAAPPASEIATLPSS
jgi:hypothetical protein